MTHSLEIVLAPVSLAARAERLGRLLRKKAIGARRDVDATALWDLTEAHLVTRGCKGASVSPRTLETYRDSVDQFLAWAGLAGVQFLRPRSWDGFAFVRALESSGLSSSSVRVRLSGA